MELSEPSLAFFESEREQGRLAMVSVHQQGDFMPGGGYLFEQLDDNSSGCGAVFQLPGE